MNNIDDVFLLMWDRLTLDEMQERIDWLRENFEAGMDWAFCSERKVMVLYNLDVSSMYRLKWFVTGQQEEIDYSQPERHGWETRS